MSPNMMCYCETHLQDERWTTGRWRRGRTRLQMMSNIWLWQNLLRTSEEASKRQMLLKLIENLLKRWKSLAGYSTAEQQQRRRTGYAGNAEDVSWRHRECVEWTGGIVSIKHVDNGVWLTSVSVARRTQPDLTWATNTGRCLHTHRSMQTTSASHRSQPTVSIRQLVQATGLNSLASQVSGRLHVCSATDTVTDRWQSFTAARL